MLGTEPFRNPAASASLVCEPAGNVGKSQFGHVQARRGVHAMILWNTQLCNELCNGTTLNLALQFPAMADEEYRELARRILAAVLSYRMHIKSVDYTMKHYV